MTAERFDFDVSGPTPAQMLDILRERVQRVYGMSLDTYADARRCGSLPEVPGRAELEVFAGDFGYAPKHEAARGQRVGG